MKLEKIRSYLFSGPGLFVMSAVLANFINLAFNAYLGRILDLDDFGDIITLTTLIYLLNLFVSSLGTTINHKVAYLEGVEKGTGTKFYRATFYKVLIPAIVASLLWLIVMPFAEQFLHISRTLIVASFAPAILFGALNAYYSGYLQGMLNFKVLAYLLLFESTTRLILAVVFAHTGLNDYVALALPISITLACIGAGAFIYLTRNHHPVSNELNNTAFPLSFYGASFMRGLSTAAFLSLDIIIAKHYLSPHDAGLYSMLSLVGKMIYFFGTLSNVFIVPIVSRMMGEGRNFTRESSILLWTTAVLSSIAAGGLWLTGPFLIPLLLGNQAVGIIPFIPLYSVAMMLFCISTTIVLYHLSRKEYTFPLLSVVVCVGYVIGLINHHEGIQDFVNVLLWTNVYYAAGVLIADSLGGRFLNVLRNIDDALLVFKRLPKIQAPQSGKLHILIYNWRDAESSFAGGAETYIHNLAERWVRDGNAVTLFTSNDSKQAPSGFIHGVRVIRRGGFFGVYLLAPLFYFFQLRNEVDVIIDCENGIPFFTPLYSNKPVYCLLHHVHQEVFRKTLPLPFALLAAFLERRVMPLVYRNKQFITVSESSKREMEVLHFSSKPITVVHPGIDLDFLQPGVKSSTPLIAYVGRLKEYKSIDVLIGAMPEILQSVPDARLIIAGDGEDHKRLKRIAKQTKVESSISFEGRVTEERKREIMQNAWVCVNPSMMEGWGITTIESNACGTPVVAANVPGLTDSVQDGVTGLLVPYGNIEGCAGALITLLTDSDTRKKMEQGAISWAQKFDWEKSARNFLTLISAAHTEPKAFKSPTHFQILIGMIILRLKKETATHEPTAQIGHYTLVRQIRKEILNKFSIAIYASGDRKFVIKTWKGRIKDFNYYSLVNEYIVSRFLSKRLREIPLSTSIHFPHVEEIIEGKNSLSVVFEYIEGTHLNQYPAEFQVTALEEITSLFGTISKTITTQDERFFIRRSLPFYIASLPLLIFFLLIFDTRRVREAIDELIKSIRTVPIGSGNLELAHRDLTSENIIVRNSEIHVIDFERVALTIPDYDRIYISTDPLLKNIREEAGLLRKNENPFMKAYMRLHLE